MNEPRTLTEAIERVRSQISALEWADQVFGRATIRERQIVGAERPEVVPMIYTGQGEYTDGRPNDSYKSVLFFVATAVERPDFTQDKPKGFAKNHVIRSRRPVALIGWVNLEKIDRKFDDLSGFGELVKLDLLNCLKQIGCVASLDAYLDTPIADVYRPFVVSDLDTKYDAYPFVVFRLDLSLMYIAARQPAVELGPIEPENLADNAND